MLSFLRNRRRHRAGRAAIPSLLTLAALLAALACGPSSPPSVRPHAGPIVLITFEGLRLDEVGALGGAGIATPNLDRLIGEADWAGAGVATSSWLAPSLASLMTGLQPWHHQVLYPLRSHLDPELVTLAEALSRLGYHTAAYTSSPWTTPQTGYEQGFDGFFRYGRGKRAIGHLKSLRDERDFLWIHIDEPEAPYQRRDWLLPPERAEGLPRRMDLADLEPYFDPAIHLLSERAREIRALYRYDVAWADEQLRRLLEALRESGHWDRTLLVVVATHGQEFGDDNQILDGGSLSRCLIEVPLVIKLPSGLPRRIAMPPGGRVSTARLWSTLIEAAGGTAPPGVAPSLFSAGAQPILSELYLADGYNEFSLVDGDLQLLWRTRFAPPDPAYFRARLVRAGGGSGMPGPRTPTEVFADLRRAFLATPPLSGRHGSHPQLRLERWAAAGTQPIEDGKATRRLAAELEAAWLRFLDEERTPGEEARSWPLKGLGNAAARRVPRGRM